MEASGKGKNLPVTLSDTTLEMMAMEIARSIRAAHFNNTMADDNFPSARSPRPASPLPESDDVQVC